MSKNSEISHPKNYALQVLHTAYPDIPQDLLEQKLAKFYLI